MSRYALHHHPKERRPESPPPHASQGWEITLAKRWLPGWVGCWGMVLVRVDQIVADSYR